jgi:para-nitrobenzyl esterase
VDGGKAYRAGTFARVPVLIGATSGDIGGKDGFMIKGAREVETLIAAQDIPVYAYRFSYVAERAPAGRPGTPPTEAASHASDVPFFFNTQGIKYGAGTTPRDNNMGATISSYIVNFARSGNPNSAGLPVWPRYDPRQNIIMDFDVTGKAVPGSDPWSNGVAKP